MLYFEILHPPVPWKAHAGFGKKAYNPRHKEKLFYQWQLRSAYNREKPISQPVKISMVFHMPIPSTTSKARRRQMLNGIIHHVVRPDCTNMQKFSEDTLKGIILEDDSQVVQIESRKIYSETPKTVITIEVLDPHLQR